MHIERLRISSLFLFLHASLPLQINFDDLPRIVLSTGRMEQIKALILIK
jgi:hypothetical protein